MGTMYFDRHKQYKCSDFSIFFSYCFEISVYPISDFSVLPGMAEAKVTTRGRSMDLDSTIKKAVKNKEIPKAVPVQGRIEFMSQFVRPLRRF